MIAPFAHSSYACLQVLSSVAFAIGLLVVSTLLLHQSIHSQELLSTAPLVGASVSLVGCCSSLVRRTFSLVGRTIPHVRPTIPHVRPTIPHVGRAIPLVRCTISQVRRTISQVGVVCFRLSTMALQLVNTIILLRTPKVKRNKRLPFLSNKGLQPWHH